MIVRDNLYRTEVLVKVLSGFQSFFREIVQDKPNTTFQVTFYLYQDSNNLINEKCLIEVELQILTELNLGLSKTGMIVTDTVCNKVVFVKYCSDFKVFSQSHK